MRAVSNKVMIEGYLRENGLELTHNDKGEEVIRGTLVVAVDDTKSYRAQFYTNKFKALKAGETVKQENKNYSKLIDLLPENTLSIASLMKESSTMSFDTAKASATKIWVIGSLQEYLRKDEKGDVISNVTIKGLSAGTKGDNDKHAFDPRATFEVEMYIEKKVAETKDGEETGRIILTGLIPEYDETVNRIDFVTGDDNASEYINDNYEVGQTVKIWGDIVNAYSRIEKGTGASSFGRAATPQYETTFTNERQIFGGNPTAWDEDDEQGLKTAEIKKALVNREQKISELPVKSESTAAPKTQRGFENTEAKKKFAFNSGNF